MLKIIIQLRRLYMKNFESIGTTYEDSFGRIDWYLDLDTKSTFCMPEISDVYEEFCKQIALSTKTIASNLEITK